MISRKKIIIVLIASVVLILSVVGIVAVFNSSNQEQTEQTAVPFKINGLDNPNYLFSMDTQAAIVLGIEQYLVADNIKTDGITGVIRKDSYIKEEMSDSTITTLLIDIPTAKRTYKISSSGSGDPNGDNRLLILCPSQNELIYSKFDCKDDTI